MLTIQSFFEKFRNDQVRLLSECEEFNVIQFFAMYDDFIELLSDLTVIGIPNNVHVDDQEILENQPFYSRQCSEYLQKKTNEMDDDSVIYFVDDLLKFGLNGDPYLANNTKRCGKLTEVANLQPFEYDEKSLFWTDSWVKTEFMNTDHIHNQYLNFKKCGDISENLVERFTNDFSVTMIIPIDHLDMDNKELFEFLSKKNTRLKTTYCEFNHDFNNKTSIFTDLSCTRLYYNNHYKPYKDLENVKYYIMIDRIITLYKFSPYHTGKYYIVVECDFESLIDGYLSKFCNYLKLVTDNYQGYIYMNNFRVKTMYNDIETRGKVLQMYDSITKLK